MILPSLLFACTPADNPGIPTVVTPPSETPPTEVPATGPSVVRAVAATMNAEGLSLQPPADIQAVDDWRVMFSLAAFGRGAGDPVPPVEPVHEGARTVYDRGDLVEWYEQRPTGVKQGFDLLTAPAGTGPIALHLAVESTLMPLFQEHTLSFLDADGHARLTYTGLETFDATGAVVPSWMEWACTDTCTVSLLVDDTGATYPLTVDPLAFSNEVVFTGFASGDNYGRAVDIAGDYAIVGAPLSDGGGIRRGSSYLYRNVVGTGWTLVTTITGNSNDNDRCGQSVAISSLATESPGRIAIGCHLDDLSGTNTGSVNVYRYSPNGSGAAFVNFEQKLLPSMPPANQERMGFSVDVDASGDRIIAGAPGRNNATGPYTAGAAYIFERSGTTWTPAARVEDTSSLTVLTRDRNLFGFAVGIDDDRAIVGAPLWDGAGGSGDNQGAAFIFERSGGSWPQVAEISGATSADRLGNGVAIEGDVAAAGRPSFSSGRVHVWRRAAGTWSQTQLITAEDAQNGDRLGWDLDLKGGDLVAGSVRDDRSGVADAGSVLLFRDSGGTFIEEVEIFTGDTSATAPVDGEEDGRWVGVSGDWVIAGSMNELTRLFQITTCRAEANPIGCDVDLRITEVHTSPFNGAAGGEFLEIYNGGTSSVQLSGATLTTNAGSITLDASQVIHGNSHAVLIDDRDEANNGGITGVPGVIEANVAFGTTNDVIELYGFDNALLSSMSYANLSSMEGTSLQLDHDGIAYADETVPYDPTQTFDPLVGSPATWCPTWRPYIVGDPDTDFMSPRELNHACERDLTVSFSYLHGSNPSFNVSGTIGFTLVGGRFYTGNSGDGEAAISGGATGQVLSMAYDTTDGPGTGVVYQANPRAFGSSCYVNGTIVNLPAGYASGSFTVDVCPP